MMAEQYFMISTILFIAGAVFFAAAGIFFAAARVGKSISFLSGRDYRRGMADIYSARAYQPKKNAQYERLFDDLAKQKEMAESSEPYLEKKRPLQRQQVTEMLHSDWETQPLGQEMPLHQYETDRNQRISGTGRETEVLGGISHESFSETALERPGTMVLEQADFLQMNGAGNEMETSVLYMDAQSVEIPLPVMVIEKELMSIPSEIVVR